MMEQQKGPNHSGVGRTIVNDSDVMTIQPLRSQIAMPARTWWELVKVLLLGPRCGDISKVSHPIDILNVYGSLARFMEVHVIAFKTPSLMAEFRIETLPFVDMKQLIELFQTDEIQIVNGVCNIYRLLVS
jgi:hypothetical protein